MSSSLLPAMVRCIVLLLFFSSHSYEGIWDCLSSQQVVNFIRLKVSEGKELTEIGEMLCDHCLAPDTSSGAGIGCDNMTVLIIAILNGRTKEEWYALVTDRVQQNYGFETPKAVPQIYAQSRLNAFKARREAQEKRERLRAEREESDNSFLTSSRASISDNTSRILGSTGGISFHPGSSIMSDTGTLMFGSDDSDDEDESGDDDANIEHSRSFFSDTFGGGSITANLKAQLDAFEREDLEQEDDTFGMEGLEDGETRLSHSTKQLI